MAHWYRIESSLKTQTLKTQTLKTQTGETVFRLRCIACGARPESAGAGFPLPACGDLLEFFFPGRVESVALNAAALKSLWLKRRTSREALDQSGVWRFRELLPHISEEHVITLREGNTPLYHLPRCARAAGVENLYAKHQGMNPTASFKDTGMTFAASSAHQDKFQWVACASTGNTSASMAAYAARGNMHSLVLIPDGKISWGKLSQSLDYGALTCQLRTDFDGCVRILNELVRQKPVYLLNSVNPYRIEGQKTAAIELMEQLAWEPPDHIIVPGGNLGNSSAIGKALLEMRELKLISRLPKLSIIQAQGANPFYRSVREFGGQKLEPMTADTLATAIRIGNPASWKKALRVLAGDRRRSRTSHRSRNRRSQSRNRRRWHRMRARLRSHAGWTQEAAPERIRQIWRGRGADPDRASAQGSRLHHQVPSRQSYLQDGPHEARGCTGKISAACPGCARC